MTTEKKRTTTEEKRQTTDKALTDDEKKRLEELELGIRNHYIYRCKAFREINSRQLYREYNTFEKYAQHKWDLERSHAYRLIGAAEVIEHLEKTNQPLPANESQAIALADYRADRDELDNIWEVVRAEGRPVTAKRINEVAAELFPSKYGPKDIQPQIPIDHHAEPTAAQSGAANRYEAVITANAAPPAIAALADALGAAHSGNTNVGNFRKEIADNQVFNSFCEVFSWVAATQPQSLSIELKRTSAA